jgi:integrase
MSDKERNLTPTPVPLILSPEEVRRFLSDERIEIPSRTRIALGLSGLSAVEVNALNVRHVSANGTDPLVIITVPNKDRRRPDFGPTRRVQLTEQTRWLLGCHLNQRRARCAHHRVLMRTETDETGVLRCAACREPIDFMSAALFNSRESDRMSVTQIRDDFRHAREVLGFNRAITFDSLRETYLAMALGGPGRRAQ